MLDSIKRGVDSNNKETTTKVMLSRHSVISLEKQKEEQNDDEKANQNGNQQQQPLWQDSLFYETTVEGKKIALVMFNCAAMSKPANAAATASVLNSAILANFGCSSQVVSTNNGAPLSVGQKFRLSFKTVNADAKLVSTICHAHGFHEVHASNTDYNLMWAGAHPKPRIKELIDKNL